MEPTFTAENPIVAAANRIRAQRESTHTLDSTTADAVPTPQDAEEALRAFATALWAGIVKLNAILGERNGVKLVRLEQPLRLRLRFAAKRIAFELDDLHQLVRISGEGFDGDWQFDSASSVPTLINLSHLSTEAHYGDGLTPSTLLRLIAQDVELPRPSHRDSSGPLQF